MSDKSDNFLGGFILGSIVGGVVGIVLASKLISSNQEYADSKEAIADEDGDTMQLSDQLAEKISVDQARISLEEKISQLNAAIDAVSQELSVSGGNGRGKTVIKSALETNYES